MDFKKLIEKIKNNKNKKKINNTTVNLAIVLLMGILILITSSFFKSTECATKNQFIENVQQENPVDNEENINKSTYKDEEKKLESQLKSILQKTQGVGRVDVMMYFSSSEEQVPAFNKNDSTNLTEETDNAGGKRNTTQKNNGSTIVVTNNGNRTEPLILETKKPKITGVLVVAEGAEDRMTECRIRKAITDLFEIADSKVNVYPMKK